MNAHDPDAPETDPGRTSSPLPRRTAALDALGPVPAPRTPGDGPVGARTAPAPPIPKARIEAPPRTPPMPWSAVAAPPGPPPVPQPPVPPPTPPPATSRNRIEWTTPSWWPEVRRFLARPAERRVAIGLAVTVVLVGSAVLALSLTARDDGVPAAQTQAGAPVAGDVAGGASVVDGAAFGGADALSFRSPTGNIECRMADDGSRCTIASRNWQLPPGAPDCPPANGTAVLAGTGPAFVSCEPSSARSAPSLGYDTALRRGDVTCVSRRDGVECRNGATGHGFAVARADYRVD
jgi:hypothetical protein